MDNIAKRSKHQLKQTTNDDHGMEINVTQRAFISLEKNTQKALRFLENR